MGGNRILSYIKSVIAAGMTLLVVLGAGIWVQAKTRTLHSLHRQIGEISAEKQDLQKIMALTGDWNLKREKLRQEILRITGKCAAKDNEGAQLVAMVVKASSEAGLRMTGAGECPTPAPLPSSQDISAVSYKFNLTGAYSGLAVFFQGMPDWQLGAKIQSVNIYPAPKPEKNTEISAELVLSVYSTGT